MVSDTYARYTDAGLEYMTVTMTIKGDNAMVGTVMDRVRDSMSTWSRV